MSDTGQVSGKTAVDLAFVAYDQGKKAGIAEAAPPARREAIWSTTAGDVRLSYPEPMPVWEVEFLEEFLRLWLRGVRRRAEAAEEAARPADTSASVAAAERSGEACADGLPGMPSPPNPGEGERARRAAIIFRTVVGSKVAMWAAASRA